MYFVWNMVIAFDQKHLNLDYYLEVSTLEKDMGNRTPYSVLTLFLASIDNLKMESQL